MKNKSEKLFSLKEAAEWCEDTFRKHPERDALAAFRDALAGRRRRHAALAINHLADPADTDEGDDEFVPPEVRVEDGEEAKLVREIVNLTAPLAMLNPMSLCLGLGAGPGTLAPSFGIPLDPDCGNSPAYTISLEEAMSRPAPDPENSGMLPEMRQRTELLKERLPAVFKIALPDMQGPFNLAHAILGDDAFLAPLENPGLFRDFMSRVTDFWIQARRNLMSWTGPERLNPRDAMVCCVAECSVNMISPDTYAEHVLPHDMRIAEAFPSIHLHPCSGPHVFHVTLKNLPGIKMTEAGHIEKTAAGAISVREALAALKGTDVMLSVGQELPEGGELDFIARDLDEYKTNTRMLFCYTGMHWRKKDRPRIRDLHRKLDEYWTANCGA